MDIILKSVLSNYKPKISWQDFVELEKSIIYSFTQALTLNENSNYQLIIKIGYRKTIDILNYIYFCTIVNDEQYKRIDFNDKTITHTPIPFKEIITVKNEFKNTNKFILLLKMFRLFLKLNIYRLHRIYKRPIYINFDSFNKDAQSYINAKNFGLILPYSIRLFNISNYKKGLSNTDEREIDLISKQITDEIIKNLPEKFSLVNNEKDELLKMIELYLKEVFQLKLKISQKPIPKRIITGTLNKNFIRTLCGLIIEKNGEVISFAHGHTLQNDDEHKFWMDMLLSTKYIEFNKSLAQELDERGRKNYLLKLPKIEYLFDYSQVNYNIRKGKETKKVLVVGNAYRESSFTSVTAFEPIIQLKIENSILDHFLNSKYEVYYKQHPGGVAKGVIKEFFEKKGVIVVNEPFEQIYNNFDLLVFYYTRTTTIKTALLSDVPIMYLNLGIEKFCEKSERMLIERCEIINWNTEQHFNR